MTPSTDFHLYSLPLQGSQILLVDSSSHMARVPGFIYPWGEGQRRERQKFWIWHLISASCKQGNRWPSYLQRTGIFKVSEMRYISHTARRFGTPCVYVLSAPSEGVSPPSVHFSPPAWNAMQSKYAMWRPQSSMSLVLSYDFQHILAQIYVVG